MHRRHVTFTQAGAVFYEDFKYVLIFTVACLIKELEWFFDRYDGNHINFLFRYLGLNKSFEAEFNADLVILAVDFFWAKEVIVEVITIVLLINMYVQLASHEPDMLHR